MLCLCEPFASLHAGKQGWVYLQIPKPISTEFTQGHYRLDLANSSWRPTPEPNNTCPRLIQKPKLAHLKRNVNVTQK